MPPDSSPGRELRRELGIGDDIRIVLSVGALSREKGHAGLLRALAAARGDPRCPPMRLMLVGDRRANEPLRALARHLGLSEIVVFCGHRADVRPYYSAADLFVLASHSEGSPNVLLEAMDAGVPIVATRVGGIPEMLTDERSALLVRRGDVKEMGSRIIRALIDGELRARLTAAGREAVAEYAPELYFKRLADVFVRLTAGLT
jgi:glycosyltransferase involved in cell wall biosynthesis